MKLQQIEVGQSQLLTNTEKTPKILEISQMLSLLSEKSNTMTEIKLPSSLPIYQIRKQNELEKKVEQWVADEANKIIDDAEYLDGEILDWELALEYAVDHLKIDFDKIDEECELIDINKEDEPKKWKAQKLLILNYLKKL